MNVAASRRVCFLRKYHVGNRTEATLNWMSVRKGKRRNEGRHQSEESLARLKAFLFS